MAENTGNGGTQKTNIVHQRAGGYRNIFADGSMVRISRGVMSILLMSEDTLIQSEEAEVAGESLRPTGQYTRSPIRIEEATVRMPLDSAVLTALNILDQVKRTRPDILDAMKLNIEVATKKPEA